MSFSPWRPGSPLSPLLLPFPSTSTHEFDYFYCFWLYFMASWRGILLDSLTIYKLQLCKSEVSFGRYFSVFFLFCMHSSFCVHIDKITSYFVCGCVRVRVCVGLVSFLICFRQMIDWGKKNEMRSGFIQLSWQDSSDHRLSPYSVYFIPSSISLSSYFSSYSFSSSFFFRPYSTASSSSSSSSSSKQNRNHLPKLK